MKSRKSAGFTVVELMIALAVGAAALIAIFSIGHSATTIFREQQRVSGTQGSLRAAMAQVKRDFQRAGFLGTSNVQQAGEACAVPGSPLDDTSNVAGRGRLAAVSAYFTNVTRPASLDPDNLNAWATVDDVTLMGNYATSGEYMDIQVSGTDITVPVTSQSFIRDFSNWYDAAGRAAGICNEGALQTAFAPGRLARVHAQNDLSFFAPIAATACDNSATARARITLANAVPPGCNANSGWISPVNTIRYWVSDAPAAASSLIGANRVSVLRRTEVDPLQKQTALVSTIGGVQRTLDDRAVLDYVVRFSVQFLMRTGSPNLGNGSSVDFVPATAAMVNAAPQQIRGVIIEIAARTPEHERNLGLTALRLPPFRVLTTPGAARTRALRAELLLPNIAMEKY